MLKFIGLVIVVLLSLFLVSCVFRLYHFSYTTESSESYFDVEAPRIEVLYPSSGSVLSNVITAYGKAWDESEFFVYSQVGTNIFSFTNANEWFFRVNTFEYTNGKIDFYFWAEDYLGNKSKVNVVSCFVSNSSFISVSPRQELLITNDNFIYTINLGLELNREATVFVNSNELAKFSNTNLVVLAIRTNEYRENETNELVVVSLEITNRKLFVFDFTSPRFYLSLGTNDYIWSDFLLNVFVQDTNYCYFYLSLGSFSNSYFFGSGVSNIVLDTRVFNNGTNELVFNGRDIAGNFSETTVLPVIVCNFFWRDVCVDAVNKYFLDYEFVSNNVWLFFTDGSFNKIYVAREENNYQKEVARGSISVDKKIRAVGVSDTLFVSYLNDSYSLYVRTNEVTNKLSSILKTINGVYDFEVSKTVSNLYLIRLHTNGYIVVSDITNGKTNFVISGMANVFSIATEKYNLDEEFSIVLVKTNPSVIELYRCGSNYYSKIFETNLAFEPDFAIVSRSDVYSYLGVIGTNKANIFILSNNVFITNLEFSSAGKFFGVSSSRYADGVVFTFSEFFYSNHSSNLKLIYLEGTSLIRNQDLGDIGNLDDIIKYLRIVTYTDKLRILIPFGISGSGGIRVFEGI